MPLHATANNGEEAYFDFMGSPFDEHPIRVVWQASAGVALLPPEIANMYTVRGYGRNLTRDEVERFNEGVEDFLAAFDADTGTQLGDLTPAPADETPAILPAVTTSAIAAPAPGIQPATPEPLLTVPTPVAAQLTPEPPRLPVIAPPTIPLDPFAAALAASGLATPPPVATPISVIPALPDVTPAIASGDTPKTGKSTKEK